MKHFARIVSVIGLFASACGGGGGGEVGSDAAPAGDAAVDVPTAGVVRVSFRDGGVAVAGARVVFLDAAGAVITSTTTDAQGAASTTMEPGGTVMLSPVTTATQTKQVYVWLGVAPGDQLAIARPGSRPRSNDMTLTVPAGPTGTVYNAYSGCGGGFSTTTAVPVMLDDNCTKTDVYIEYENSQSPYEFRGAVLARDVAVTDNGTVDLSAATVYQRATMHLAVTGLPAATTTIFSGGFLQRGGVRIRPSYEATSTNVTQGAITLDVTALPAFPSVDLVSVFQIRDANTGNAAQMFRLAPVATTSTVALAGHVLPFLDSPVFDHTTRVLSWHESGGDRSADGVFAQFDIDDGSYGSEWFVTAPAGTSPTVTLPAFPPDLAELALGPTDEVAVGLYTVGTPGGYAALRQRVFTVDEEFDLATTAGIVSTSFVYHDED